MHELFHARLFTTHGFVGRAVEDELALVHHADAIGDGEQAIDVARHHDDRRFAAQLLFAQKIEDLLRGDRVETRGRLVVKDDGRFRDRGARDADALLLTKPPSDTARKRSSTRSRISVSGTVNMRRSGNAMLSATVMKSKSALFWNSMPNLSRNEASSMSLMAWTFAPSTDTEPESGRMRPVIILSSTLLPLAPGPMSP